MMLKLSGAVLVALMSLTATEAKRQKPQESEDIAIAQCMAEPATADKVLKLLNIQTRVALSEDWLMPSKFGSFSNPANGDLPSPPFPPGSTEGFQWFSNRMPFAFSEENKLNYAGLPPDFDPEAPYANQLPGFNHFQEDVSNWGHSKFPAVPTCFLIYTGRDPDTFSSKTTTVFSMNLEDRGVDPEDKTSNWRKKQYMSALTCDKMTEYEQKVDNMLATFLDDIMGNEKKPVLSSWNNAVEDFFLDIHFGTTDVPDFVRKYFSIVRDVISDIGGNCSPLSENFDFQQKLFGTCAAAEVKAWALQRRQVIADTEDESTLIFWWDKAGMTQETLIQEAVHNVLAFSQFVNSLFLLITAKIPSPLGGYVAIDKLQDGIVVPPPNRDFFAEYKNAETDAERLNVAREAFRLLLPNNTWLSHRESSSDLNKGKAYSDPDFEHSSTFFLPSLIQALNDGLGPDGSTQASAYDTSRYDDFIPDDEVITGPSCPFARGNRLGPEDFVLSSVDGETQIPAGHEKLFPVYPQPKYCPFGLGYRRCPGEMLNMMVMEKILEALEEVSFTVSYIPEGEDFYTLWNPTGVGIVPDSVPTGLVRRLDNIVVA